MDDADQAQRAEAAFLEAALAKVIRGWGAFHDQANPDAPARVEEWAVWCCDCGEPISAARRQAMPGCRRCRDCQACQDLYESERP
ncbi:TraR/DksA C4-type zinc finger protein [Megalodesulfovibrio paquesii]